MEGKLDGRGRTYEGRHGVAVGIRKAMHPGLPIVRTVRPGKAGEQRCQRPDNHRVQGGVHRVFVRTADECVHAELLRRGSRHGGPCTPQEHDGDQQASHFLLSLLS